jgi:regulator of protease activity HflC (stomatin/prohibitin superfamily)
MSARPRMYSQSVAPGSRSLYKVQNILRFWVWLLIIILIALPALVLALALGLSSALGVVVLIVGGLIALGLAGMFSSSIYIIPEFQRAIVFKMGKFKGVKGPGFFMAIRHPPFFQSVAAILDIRVQTRVITAAETLTADNVPVGCEAVIFWRVEDPERAALAVANYAEAVFQAANSALKDTVGTLELTDLLGERDKVAEKLENIIDTAAASFGVDVSSVEITDVRVPSDLIQELSVLAQSRRSASAKIAEADAEMAIAMKLQEASESMGPRAMEMYRLNVLERIGREEGSQIVVYGLGSTDPLMETTLAAATAGSMSHLHANKKPPAPPVPPAK